ncbi:MAG: hypothetical protein ABSA96_00690 [Candidatus Acidiferrales bacterium]
MATTQNLALKVTQIDSPPDDVLFSHIDRPCRHIELRFGSRTEWDVCDRGFVAANCHTQLTLVQPECGPRRRRHEIAAPTPTRNPIQLPAAARGFTTLVPLNEKHRSDGYHPSHDKSKRLQLVTKPVKHEDIPEPNCNRRQNNN